MKGTILKLGTKHQERRLATNGWGAEYSLIAQWDDEKLQSGAEQNGHMRFSEESLEWRLPFSLISE